MKMALKKPGFYGFYTFFVKFYTNHI